MKPTMTPKEAIRKGAIIIGRILCIWIFLNILTTVFALGENYFVIQHIKPGSGDVALLSALTVIHTLYFLNTFISIALGILVPDRYFAVRAGSIFRNIGILTVAYGVLIALFLL